MGRREGIMWIGGSRKDSKLVVRRVCTPQGLRSPQHAWPSMKTSSHLKDFGSVIHSLVVVLWNDHTQVGAEM